MDGLTTSGICHLGVNLAANNAFEEVSWAPMTMAEPACWRLLFFFQHFLMMFSGELAALK